MKKTKALALVLSFFATAALFYYVLSGDGTRVLKTVLTGIDLTYFSFFLCLSLASIFFRAWRYQLVLAMSGDFRESVKSADLVLITAIRNAVADLLPMRLGEASVILMLKRWGVPWLPASFVFGYTFVFDVIALMFLVALVVVYTVFKQGWLFDEGESVVSGIAFCFVATVLVLILFFCIYRVRLLFAFLIKSLSFVKGKISGNSGQQLLRIVGLIGKFSAHLCELDRQIGVHAKPIQLFYVAILTLLVRFAKYLGLYFLLLGVVSPWGFSYREVSFHIVLLAFIVAEGMLQVPFSGFMGFGMYEGGWVAVLSAYGLQIPEKTRVIFALHLITQLVAYFVAIVFLTWFRFRSPNPNSSSPLVLRER